MLNVAVSVEVKFVDAVWQFHMRSSRGFKHAYVLSNVEINVAACDVSGVDTASITPNWKDTASFEPTTDANQ